MTSLTDLKLFLVEDEGSNHINISKYSKTELGKLLSPGHPLNVDTLYGTIGNIRSAMDYLVTEKYPINFLSKKKLSKDMISKLDKSKKRILPNYWAAVGYTICERVLQDEKLIELIKKTNPSLELTSYTIKRVERHGVSSNNYTLNTKMKQYVNILNKIFRLIRNNNFNSVSMLLLVNDLKSDSKLSIFHNVPFTIKTDI